MKNRFYFPIRLFAAFLSSSIACGANSPEPSVAICSKADSRAAEMAVDQMDSWEHLLSMFEKYSQCDQAAVAEGLDDVVVRLLTKKWESIQTASELVQKYPGFGSFILRHITELASQEEIDNIREKATKHCPAASTVLCSEFIATIHQLEAAGG